MSNDPSASANNAPSYRSGTAARLSGIPVETLRVWERRYQVVGPALSSHGQRLYSSLDIQRLTLIKQLVDMGHPIGQIAGLTTEALSLMVKTPFHQKDRQDSKRDTDTPTRVALVGPFISSASVQTTLTEGGLSIAGFSASSGVATRSLKGLKADVLAVEMPTLGEESLEIVDSLKAACEAHSVLVLYRFAPSRIIRLLRNAGYILSRVSPDPGDLLNLCLTAAHSSVLPLPSGPAGGAGSPPPPRFDDQALSRFLQRNSANHPLCECPKHLVDLIASLGSFERYSADCISQSPEDKRLHLDLQFTAGHARALLENALLRVTNHHLGTAHEGAYND
ncbi:MAG: MerR family transcriptional regulator [Alcaligenaceae bacterium]|nr:MerR family transcriptional regulator [Alcaligenaceae bacterium]